LNATLIRHGQRILTIADIQVGDHVEVRGSVDGSPASSQADQAED
jgi:hypothetical protein